MLMIDQQSGARDRLAPMATRTREDRRLRLLSAVCLALPGAERTNCGAHADFRVRGKIFAYFLRNHDGDGITAACFKSRLGQHVEHVKRAPDRFYLPRYIGRRGWLGVRLDQGDIDWDEVGALAAISYSLAVPKGLRAAPTPVANALTSRSLVRGAPAPMLVGGSRLNAAPMPAERAAPDEGGDAEKRLRPAAVPGAAIIRRSGGLRGRR
jgi:predicted DNA-binding protein (MmcQ/YjbR family)